VTDHQATPEQWHELERCSHGSQPWAPCILELRARVEALEVSKRPASRVHEISKPLQLTPEQAQHVRDLLAPNSKPTPNSSQIGRSLVKRVQGAIHDVVFPHGYDEARAAIREVAAWLIDRRLDDDWLAPFEELADLLLEEAQR
jgi:hypothetical protein